MTKEQLINIAKKYDDLLLKDGFLNRQDNDEAGSLQHCRWMLGQIPDIVASNKIEKANRWLGFVQGILWAHGYCTITEMKSHNRTPIDETFEGGKSFMMYGD